MKLKLKLKLPHHRKANQLQYEFLPAALEIVETPPSPLGRVVIWLIVALLAIAITWSYFGKIDVIAVGQGKVIPEGNVKTIQPANGGVISAIKVSEGEHVKKGQLLVELDTALATVDVNSVETSLATAKLERDVLKKVLAGEDVTELVRTANVPQDTKDGLQELAKSQGSVARVRRQFLSVSISQARSQLAIEQQNLQTIQSNLQAAQYHQQTLEIEIPFTTGPQQSVLQAELQQVNGQVMDLQSALMTQKQRVAQAQAGVNEARANQSRFEAENASSTLTDVVDQDKQIAQLEDNLAKAKKSVELMHITSPVDGTILSLASNTIGGVVTIAEPLIVIVPEGTPLVVEASLQNRDVGFVRKGQKVAIKIDTYSFQRYGYLRGTVRSVSPDSFDDQKHGSVYKMKITLDGNKTSKDNVIQVSPGMSVVSEITTDKRRIIEFFFDPFVTHVDNSLKMR